MNAIQRRRLYKLADHFEQNVRPEEFNMQILLMAPTQVNDKLLARNLLRHKCNSVGCIAGHAMALFHGQINWTGDLMLEARRLLGIEPLPFSRDLLTDLTIHTPRQAARRLRKLADQRETK